MNIPTFSDQEAILAAKSLINQHFQNVGKDQCKLGIHFDPVFNETIYPLYEIDFKEGVDLGVDESGQQICGCYQIRQNRILIGIPRDDPRWTFTCWHEVGHAILHGPWFRWKSANGCCGEDFVSTDHSLSPMNVSRLERQANTFAAHASAPEWLVVYASKQALGIERPIRFIKPSEYRFEAFGEQKYFFARAFHVTVCGFE